MARKATSRGVLHKRIFEHISANRWFWFAGLTVVILSAATSYFAVELRSIEAFTGPTGGGGSGTGAIVTDAEGDIGIGTSTTPYKLNVQGQINSSGGLCIGGDCKSAWSQVAPPQQWLTSGSNLYYTAGSVGIGNTPNTPLDVTGNATIRGDIIGNNNSALNLYQNTGASNGSFLELNTANAILGAGNTGSIILRDYNGSSWDDNLTILSTGRVGVATSSPGFAFSVQGQANASGGLCIADDCKTSWSQVGGSQWTTGSGLIYYNGGNVGINHSNPDGKLAIIKNTAATTWTENENDWGIKLADGTGDTAIVIGVSSGQNTAAIQVMDPSTAWTGRDLLLQPVAGSVGIGTVSPAGTESTSRLTVQASDGSALSSAIINTGAGQVGLILNRTGTTPARWYAYIPGGSTDLRFYNGADRMTLSNGGNLTVNSITLGGNSIVAAPGTYGSIALTTAKNSYYSIYLGPNAGSPNFMFDTGGNGGLYYEGAIWASYYNRSYNGWNINASSVDAKTYALNVNGSIYANTWIRTANATGWYNETYGGGWYMADTTWVRSYGSKSVYIDAAIRADGGIVSGPYGSQGGSTIYAGGNVWAGAYYYTSDIRLKKDVRPIENALDLVSQLQGRRFVWKDSEKPSLGLIAQEVEQVIPEAVYYDEKNDRKFIDSGILIGPMVESIKELKARVEAQENKIGELQKEIEALKQK